MRLKVVENYVNTFFGRIASSHPFEGLQRLLPSFAPTEVPPEFVLLDVEKGKPLTCSMGPGVCRRQPDGPVRLDPASSVDRPEFKRPQFIIAKKVGPLRRMLIEPI